jgi:hypothetical protein
MANDQPPVQPLPPREFSPLAGLLSYLVPGLGQISQGRTGKGLLFFVCIYALFFYGMYLGTGTVKAGEFEYRVPGNVYLPDTMRGMENVQLANPYKLPAFALDLYNRPQFAGQFWVGMAAWPAIVQYSHDDDQRALREIQARRAEADRLDQTQPAEADRMRKDADKLSLGLHTGNWPGNPIFGQFERAPTEEALNALNTSRDKELELGWVYTVIAGVLNIMVIYDAMAGPAFPAVPKVLAPGRGD